MTKQENIALSEYSDKAMQIRGALINEAISLERMIDYFIACHLCKTENKRQEFCELILGTERMAFGAKKQVFEALRDKYNKSDKEKKLTNSISKNLKNILKRRNVFAHIQLSMRIEDAIHFKKTGEITFIHFTNGIEFHH